jgi:hypothetical protein
VLPGPGKKHTDIQTAGVKAGAKSILSLNQNMVSLSSASIMGKAPRKSRRQDDG